MQYGTFLNAYKKEELQQHPRVSQDVPSDFSEWKQIVQSTPVIVLYLWSEGCRPCSLIRDKYEALASKYQSENILFFKDNIDNPMSFHRGQVEAVPAFFLLVDGQELNTPVLKSRHVGWTEEMQHSIPRLLQVSKLYHTRLQQQSTAVNPQNGGGERRMHCKDNVCYLTRG
jgi:hypothetical protein